jgi:hypothetical protein
VLNDRGDIFGRGAGHRSRERRIVDLVAAVRGWHGGSNPTLSANLTFFVFNYLACRVGSLRAPAGKTDRLSPQFIVTIARISRV